MKGRASTGHLGFESPAMSSDQPSLRIDMRASKLTGIPEAQLMPAPATMMIRLDCRMVPVNCRMVVCVDSDSVDEAWSRLTCFIVVDMMGVRRCEEGKGCPHSSQGQDLYRQASRKEAGKLRRVWFKKLPNDACVRHCEAAH